MTENVQYVVITFWGTQEHGVELITADEQEAQQVYNGMRFALLAIDGYEVTFENLEKHWQSYLEATHDRVVAKILVYELESENA